MPVSKESRNSQLSMAKEQNVAGENFPKRVQVFFIGKDGGTLYLSLKSRNIRQQSSCYAIIV
jgi:hypothetical protein